MLRRNSHRIFASVIDRCRTAAPVHNCMK